MHRALIYYILEARFNGRMEEELAVRGALIQDDHDLSSMGLWGNHNQYARMFGHLNATASSIANWLRLPLNNLLVIEKTRKEVIVRLVDQQPLSCISASLSPRRSFPCTSTIAPHQSSGTEEARFSSFWRLRHQCSPHGRESLAENYRSHCKPYGRRGFDRTSETISGQTATTATILRIHLHRHSDVVAKIEQTSEHAI